MIASLLKRIKLTLDHISPFSYGLLIVSLFSSLFFFPNISHLQVHDNLDGFVATLKLISKHPYFFTFNPDILINEVMLGLPRSMFSSMFYIPALLFYLLPAFFAYAVNAFLVNIIAYIGMYQLGLRYLTWGKYNQLISAGSALCFSLLPTYHVYGVSIVGIPLLSYAILNIYKKLILNGIMLSSLCFHSIHYYHLPECLYLLC